MRSMAVIRELLHFSSSISIPRFLYLAKHFLLRLLGNIWNSWVFFCPLMCHCESIHRPTLPFTPSSTSFTKSWK
uniref:Uncharacterized protein n=1 Tax=Picea glauca TaxID=3330 RepID=A0A101M3U2_PICGL|nr:hypothetical protein ABT39_MTgene428 [Picea glauca]